MTSAYLQNGDLAAFGVPSASAVQIAQSSTLIDAYLSRPEGLVWVADGQGQPAYMQALSPMYSFGATSAISPGVAVQVPLSGPTSALQIGDCLILDRANPSLCEAVIVGAITGNTATLTQVVNSHAFGATLDYGLVIEEQKYLPESRPITFAAKTPLMRVIAGVGRYAYGRRGDAANYQMDQFNLLAALSKFGGPPVWEIFQPTNLSIDPATGQMWIPAGVMLAYYSEIKVRYVAGYAYANLPAEIKLACAQLVTNLATNPMLGNIKTTKAGDTAMTQFSSSVISDDIKALLAPWRARLFA